MAAAGLVLGTAATGAAAACFGGRPATEGPLPVVSCRVGVAVPELGAAAAALMIDLTGVAGAEWVLGAACPAAAPPEAPDSDPRRSMGAPPGVMAFPDSRASSCATSAARAGLGAASPPPDAALDPPAVGAAADAAGDNTCSGFTAGLATITGAAAAPGAEEPDSGNGLDVAEEWVAAVLAGLVAGGFLERAMTSSSGSLAGVFLMFSTAEMRGPRGQATRLICTRMS